LLAIVRDDAVCRRLMTTPGVGPVVALTYSATVDVPARFRKSKSVGAVFGLTCAKYQSGEIERSGRISRCGDEMMRVMLYEAAQSMLRSKKWSWLKAWAMQIARRRGMKKAIVALARRLAVIMHRIWVDGTEFRWWSLAPGRHGYQRAGELISGKASTDHLGQQCSRAPGRPNLHLVSSSRRPRLATNFFQMLTPPEACLLQRRGCRPKHPMRYARVC
jgi:hypothetical protein